MKIFGTILCNLNIGLMKSGRVQWQKAEEIRKYFNIVLIHQDKKFFISELFKVIQDAIIDPSLQDNVLIPNGFFEYICHIGCGINLHSIVNSGLIPGGSNLSKRQTVFFTSVDPMNKDIKIPMSLTWMHRVLFGTSRKYGRNIKTQCIGLTSNLLKRKDLSSIKRDRTQSSFYDTLPAYCIPKAIMMGSGEVIYEKGYEAPRLPPKMSFKGNWMKELGSQVAGGGKDSQQTQPKPNIQLLEQGDLFRQSNNRFECSGNRKRF